MNLLLGTALRSLAKELRVNSQMSSKEEFATYKDESLPDEHWHQLIQKPPTTTTHVNICIVKPRTTSLKGSYATTIIQQGLHGCQPQ